MAIYNAPERAGTVAALPVAASTKIEAGNLIALNATGYAVHATAADLATVVIGRAEHDADNSGGSAGALTVNVKRGCFRYDNSSTAAITAAHVGRIAYVEDSHTVQKAPSPAADAVPAGVIIAVDAEGVWVDTRVKAADAYLED